MFKYAREIMCLSIALCFLVLAGGAIYVVAVVFDREGVWV